MERLGKGGPIDPPDRASRTLVAFYWNGASPLAHPVSHITEAGFYMTTADRWHLGTLLTLTLQPQPDASASEANVYLVVLARVVGHDETGTFLEFVPITGDRQSPLVRPASKKEIAQFLRAFGASM